MTCTKIGNNGQAPKHQLKQNPILNDSNDPKAPENKYTCNLHYDDVQGYVLRPSHGTTPDTVKINKFCTVRSFGSKEYTKIN